MNEILLWIGAVGITLITARGNIFKSIKMRIKNQTLKDFADCPQCQGFWIGTIFAFTNLFLEQFSGIGIQLITSLLVGGAVSITALVIDFGISYLYVQEQLAKVTIQETIERLRRSEQPQGANATNKGSLHKTSG